VETPIECLCLFSCRVAQSGPREFAPLLTHAHRAKEKRMQLFFGLSHFTLRQGWTLGVIFYLHEVRRDVVTQFWESLWTWISFSLLLAILCFRYIGLTHWPSRILSWFSQEASSGAIYRPWILANICCWGPSSCGAMSQRRGTSRSLSLRSRTSRGQVQYSEYIIFISAEFWSYFLVACLGVFSQISPTRRTRETQICMTSRFKTPHSPFGVSSARPAAYARLR